MSLEAHHHDALLETAASELDRAHRGALALEAGEVRRGLQLAAKALREAEAPAEAGLAEAALADLDRGALSETAALIEAARKAVEDARPAAG